MSLIHKFITESGTPEPIKILFQHFIDEFKNQSSEVWQKQVISQNDNYHRKVLLKQGRCDFDNPTLELTSNELIVLYNYYYFPMHWQSSFSLYTELLTKHSEFKNQQFFFHDFGCGTLSSSIAFALAYSKQMPITSDINDKTNNSITLMHYLINYLDNNNSVKCFNIVNELGFRMQNEDEYVFPPNINGYWLNDISRNICKYNVGLIQEHFHQDNADVYDTLFFNKALGFGENGPYSLMVDKFYVGKFQKIIPFEAFTKFLGKENKEFSVILNFSYVLASDTIEVSAIIDLINEYSKTGCKLIIVNQNPDLDRLNIKWEQIKKTVPSISLKKGLLPIKHFSNSKSRCEIIIHN